MTITGDVIRRLMTSHHHTELPSIIDKIVKIQARISYAKERCDAAQKAHKIESEIADREVMEARSMCHHWLTQEHRSPVDSSDNWTECLVCGKSIN